MEIKQIPKERRELAALAQKQGWDLMPTSNGHIKWVPPDARDDIVISGSTPSEFRSSANLISQLKKSGFVDSPEEWNRIRQMNICHESILESPTSMKTFSEYAELIRVANDPSEVWTKSTRSNVEWLFIDVVVRSMTRAQEFAKVGENAYSGEWFEQTFLDKSGLLGSDVGAISESLSCGCGFKGSIIELAKHCRTKGGNAIRPHHQLRVQMIVPGGEKVLLGFAGRSRANAIECPECDFTCYKSQPHIMDEHLDKTHKGSLERCVFCSYIVPTEEIDSHHERECAALVDAEEQRVLEELVRSEEDIDLDAPDPSAPEPVPDPERPLTIETLATLVEYVYGPTYGDLDGAMAAITATLDGLRAAVHYKRE